MKYEALHKRLEERRLSYSYLHYTSRSTVDFLNKIEIVIVFNSSVIIMWKAVL